MRLCLLYPSVKQFSYRAAARRRQIHKIKLVLRNGFDDALLVRAVEVGVAAAFDMKHEGPVWLTHRIAAEKGKAAFHSRLTFRWRGHHAIVGCELRDIGIHQDQREAPILLENQCASAARPIGLIRGSVGARRADRDKRPASHELLLEG